MNRLETRRLPHKKRSPLCVDDTQIQPFVAPRGSIAARLVLAAGNVVGQRHQRRGARGVEAGQLSLG